jgi:alginate O-acetyltransferase complex protein AlgJ
MEQNKYSILFLASVTIIMCIPILFWPFDFHQGEWTENRTKYECPNIIISMTESYNEYGISVSSSFHGLKKFTVQFTDYFNDNFAFRNILVDLQRQYKLRVFSTDPIPNRLFQGVDGWLFVGDNFGNAVKEYSGLSIMTKEEIHSLDQWIDSQYQWCSEHGIVYRFAITPDKHRVFDNYLPYQSRKFSNYDIVNNITGGHVPIVDLGENLGPNIFNKYYTYHKGDSHWNALGALIGYRNLMNSIISEIEIESVLSFSNFGLEYKIPSYADLYTMLGQSPLEPEPTLTPLFRQTGQLAEDELSVPVDVKNNVNYEIRYINVNKSKKILFFRDSFSTELIPYLKESFGEVVLIWDYKFDTTVVSREKPDIVVYQVVGRNIDAVSRK